MAAVVLTAHPSRRRQVGHDILYACELPSIRGVGSARHLLNLFLHSLYAVAGIRVVREKLSRSGLALLCLQLFKQLRHLDRIVSSLGHDLGAVVIRLTLGGPRHFKEYGASSQSNAQLSQLSEQPVAGESSAQNSRKLEKIRFRCLVGPMPHPDVPHLMSEHARQLGFV